MYLQRICHESLKAIIPITTAIAATVAINTANINTSSTPVTLPLISFFIIGLFSQYVKIFALKTVPVAPIYAVSSALINLPVVGS